MCLILILRGLGMWGDICGNQGALQAGRGWGCQTAPSTSGELAHPTEKPCPSTVVVSQVWSLHQLLQLLQLPWELVRREILGLTRNSGEGGPWVLRGPQETVTNSQV